MYLIPLLVLAAAPSTTVTPFRTEVTPRVDPVFGDVASIRKAVDKFLTLQGEMEQVRSEFSTSVHGTLAQLAPDPARPKGCPVSAGAHYGRAMVAGGRYLALGRQLDARFREIRRSDELGDALGSTPDYRLKVKRARELYLELLRDYREMRVAFYDQLGAEMRHAGCAITEVRSAGMPISVGLGRDPANATPDPSHLTSWDLENAAAAAGPLAIPPPTDDRRPPRATTAGSAPAIWITIDNSHCPQVTALSIDGAALGPIAGRRKVSVRTRAGPHELCVLPSSDKRSCGDAGTIRRAYLHEGWTLAVRCEK